MAGSRRKVQKQILHKGGSLFDLNASEVVMMGSVRDIGNLKHPKPSINYTYLNGGRLYYINNRRTGLRDRRSGANNRTTHLGETGFEAKKKPAFRMTADEFEKLDPKIKSALKVQRKKDGFIYLKDHRRPSNDRRK